MLLVHVQEQMYWLDEGLADGCRGAVAVQAIVCLGLSVISPIACEMGHRSRRDVFTGLSRVEEGGAKNKERQREGEKKGGPSERTSPLRPPLQDAEVTLVSHGRLVGDVDVRVLTKTNRGIRGICTYSTLYAQDRFQEREGACT